MRNRFGFAKSRRLCRRFGRRPKISILQQQMVLLCSTNRLRRFSKRKAFCFCVIIRTGNARGAFGPQIGPYSGRAGTVIDCNIKRPLCGWANKVGSRNMLCIFRFCVIIRNGFGFAKSRRQSRRFGQRPKISYLCYNRNHKAKDETFAFLLY